MSKFMPGLAATGQKPALLHETSLAPGLVPRIVQFARQK